MPKPKKNKATDGNELTEASAMAMSSMRALDFEVVSDGSQMLMASRVADVAFFLSDLARQLGYPAAADSFNATARLINNEVYPKLIAGFKPNSRRPDDSRGLAGDPALLQSYVEMAAESMELENWKDAEPNDEVQAVAAEYDAALKDALEELVKKYPPENDADADDLWKRNAPYLVLMTLRGEGVGIWDGDWTDFYEDTDKAEAFLKKKLGKFADGSGAGKLEEAFMNAASESCGDEEDDSDDEEDDDAGDD